MVTVNSNDELLKKCSYVAISSYRRKVLETLKNDVKIPTKISEEVLEKFRKSENSNVLVSPSMNEGVDLPYDDCRFQIIYKIPYPNISDAQIKARKNIDDYWYLYKTALTLLQTYGRGMRAEDDYCTTYIIDNRVKRFVSQNKKNGLIPDYFIEAIK